VMTRQLSTLIDAGLPLLRCINVLIAQLKPSKLRDILREVSSDIQSGSTFAEALSKHPKQFDRLFVNMVRAGESSGALDVVLGRLADFTESQAELRSKVAGTLFYPIIMMVMAGVVTGVLFMFVIPKIKMIFDAQKVALPLPTEVLIGISGFARDFWFVVLPLLILCIWAWIRFINSKRGRPWWDETLLKMPVFGPLVRMIAVTRFAKTLATLLSSGVPVLTAFDIVKNVVENRTLMKVIEDARDAVKEGDAIAAPFQRSGEFPAIMTHMIAVGEKTGQLEEMLNNVARAYEVQVEARLRAMTTILEPVMIIFMGVIVAFIVLSIILPMLELSSFT